MNITASPGAAVTAKQAEYLGLVRTADRVWKWRAAGRILVRGKLAGHETFSVADLVELDALADRHHNSAASKAAKGNA